MKPQQQSSQRHSSTTNHNLPSASQGFIGTAATEGIDGEIENTLQNDIYINSNIAFTSQDLTRLMIQSLYNLGYRESAAKLEMESGLQTQSCIVRQLFSAIVQGNWESCYQLVKIVEFTIDLKIVIGMITELVYIELILSKQTKVALNLLRTDLRLSVQDPVRLKILSSCLLCSDEIQLLKMCKGSNIMTSRTALTNELKKFISPDQLIGETCLEDLVIEALQCRNSHGQGKGSNPPSPNHTKKNSPKFPFKRLKPFSSDENLQPSSPLDIHDHTLTLYSLLGENNDSEDPRSDRTETELPSREIAVLKGHKNEIWLVSFSPCGKYLATAGIDDVINIWRIYSEHEDNISFHPSHFLTLLGPSFAHSNSQSSHPISMSWNEFSNKLLCCYENDDGVYLWDMTAVMTNSSPSNGNGGTSISFSTRYSHHSRGNSNGMLDEMCTVSWLTIPSEEKQLFSTNDIDMREYFVSLSHPFHMFICDLEGDIFASYSGFDGNIASHVLSIPHLKLDDLRSSHNSNPNKNILQVHVSDQQLRGWKSMSEVIISPTPGGDCDDNETWKESKGDDDVSYPCGSRVVVVKSEVCLQLFLVTANVCPQSSPPQPQVSGGKTCPPYRFELITELNISLPIVTLTLLPLLGSKSDRDCVLLLSCLGGPLRTLVIESDNTLRIGGNYSGYKLNRMISQPSGYRFLVKDHQERIHLACGNENATTTLWNEFESPVDVLRGHSATVNAVHFSPHQRGLLATVSDDQTVRLWSSTNDPQIQELSEPFVISIESEEDDSNEMMARDRRLQRFQEMMLLGKPIK